MDQLSGSAAQRKIKKALGCVAAAVLFAVTALQPVVANAAHGGGGGFHGGGGGFHAGGLHGGGFHGFHAGAFDGRFAGAYGAFNHGGGGHWYHGWHGGRYGWWLVGPGLAWTYYDYPWWGYYPAYGDYGYYPDSGYYGSAQPYAGQTWYYCSDPAGYYPYVTQCNTGWQAVPAS
jgi:hypothetical protein